MSIWGHRVTARLVVMAIVLVAVGGLLTASVVRAPEREITLVARGMAFYLEGNTSTANPTLTFKAGERVRVVLRNQDRGITHDFAVPLMDAAVDAIDWNEDAGVTFTVPDAPGRYEYTCRPHALMMRGEIVVEP